MKQIGIIFLLLMILSIGVESCSSDEQLTIESESQTQLDPATIDELYNKYSEFTKESLEVAFNSLPINKTRGRILADTPRDIGKEILDYSDEELLKLLDELQPQYDKFEREYKEAWSIFCENLSEEDLLVYRDFIRSYPFSENKKSTLNKVARSYSTNSAMGNTLIATAARIDIVQVHISDAILEHERVIVTGDISYMRACELELIRDLAAMCAEDVIVDLAGGGPEDPSADVYVTAADIYEAIKIYRSYKDCKDKLG